MREMKESRKTRYTRQVIRESFLELLEEKPIESITVKEIAERADINRATFYAHYDNVEDLARTLEGEMAEEVIAAIDEYYEDWENQAGFIDELFGMLQSDRELCGWFLRENTTGYGQKLISDYAREKCVPEWRRAGGISERQAEYVFTFVFNGAFSLFQDWYLNGSEDDTEGVRDLLYQLAHNALRYVYGERDKKAR